MQAPLLAVEVPWGALQHAKQFALGPLAALELTALAALAALVSLAELAVLVVLQALAVLMDLAVLTDLAMLAAPLCLEEQQALLLHLALPRPSPAL